MKLHCYLKKSEINIFSKKLIFLRKHTPLIVAIPHLLVYSRTILVDFSAKKVNLNFLGFAPLLNPCFPFINKIRGAPGQFLLINFEILGKRSLRIDASRCGGGGHYGQ